MKKIEDNSCIFPSHFWSTYQSPFSTFYIPFQSSGSQKSNALNRVWFGAEMRKIWPLEDNCIKPWEHHFARRFSSWWEIWPLRTMKNHLAKFGPFIFPFAKFPLFLHARTTEFPDICSLIFSRVNSFCNLVFSRHKALSYNFAIYRGAQRLQKRLDDWGIDPLYINLKIYKALFFSLLLFFPISIEKMFSLKNLRTTLWSLCLQGIASTHLET